MFSRVKFAGKAALDTARPVFENRISSVVELCKDKNVLDLGCTQHRMLGQEVEIENWLHWRIKQVASSLVGVDYLQDEVDRLNKKGFNIVCSNVYDLHPDHIHLEKIDVIVCGELIEHLPNPGTFLMTVKKLMTENSILVITTPNAYDLHRMNLMLRKRYEDQWLNKEHKCWYTFNTLMQLLEFCGFAEVQWGYYGGRKAPVTFLKRRIHALKKRFNYKHISQVELSEGLFFVSKAKSLE